MKKNRCASCGGTLVAQKICYDKKVGKRMFSFEDVPALVCSACDEVWMDGKTVEKMEKILHKGLKPTRWARVPIWSLSRAA